MAASVRAQLGIVSARMVASAFLGICGHIILARCCTKRSQSTFTVVLLLVWQVRLRKLLSAEATQCAFVCAMSNK